MYKCFLKRFFDFLIAMLIILFLVPVFLAVYVLVKMDSKGDFFFFQERLGKAGKVFMVFKIRTMTDKVRVADREILRGDSEVTRMGAILRRLKIDELPQILNIFKGDMSFVGPRPCLPNQIHEFNEDGAKRILVKPGLTGMAQVNGNIFLTWEERWKYDRYYVEHYDFILDCKILFKTVGIVIKGEENFLKKP